MVWSSKNKKEDEEKRREGETTDARMARILTPAMNLVNKDLRFTTELCEDFADNKTPTLDFKMWFEKD